MIRNIAEDILNSIQHNQGLEKAEVFSKPSISVQKIMDIIVSECKCSILEPNGNYSRYGSSIDIRIIKNLVKTFLSNATKIPPELVSMSLTKEEVLGPFIKININKIYDSLTNNYTLQMEELFPTDFQTSIFDTNAQLKNDLIDEIIKPYVKNIIFENDELMKKSPIGSWAAKKTYKPKTDEEMHASMVSILKNVVKSDDQQIENIANYILINMLQNKSFKQELIANAINATELQMLGKVYTGFSGMVETMISQVAQIIELKEIPYEEYYSIGDVFYTTITILEALSTNFEYKTEAQILKEIEHINTNFNTNAANPNNRGFEYRKEEIQTDKLGNVAEYVKPQDIQLALANLCKDIKNLLDNKDQIGMDTYIKEVIRIHYRFIRIQPFTNANSRTARAIVNILLQSNELIGIFRKEKKNDYINSIREANRIIKEHEGRYIENLTKNTEECKEFENEFLEKELPFLLLKY